MKTLPDLSQFSGTESYHKISLGSDLVATDGIVYLAQEVGAFWLFDIVASVQHRPKVRGGRDFLVWRIVVKDQSAVVSGYTDCEPDGSYSFKKCVYSQRITYTDFPEGEFEFYQEGNVLLLKGER
jgi:hypothetical protein